MLFTWLSQTALDYEFTIHCSTGLGETEFCENFLDSSTFELAIFDGGDQVARCAIFACEAFEAFDRLFHQTNVQASESTRRTDKHADKSVGDALVIETYRHRASASDAVTFHVVENACHFP